MSGQSWHLGDGSNSVESAVQNQDYRFFQLARMLVDQGVTDQASFSALATYLGLSGGSGQDMQVAWTPTNLKLGELIGFSAFAGLAGITSITFEEATSIGQFDIESCTELISLSWPNLVLCDPLNIQGGGLYAVSNPALTSISAPLLQVAAVIGIRDDNALTSLSFPALTTIVGQFDVENCTALTSISFPNFLPSNAADIRASGCALSSATINHILARGIASPAFVTGQINIDGQTPAAAPSGQGIADKAALILRGVTVNTD